VSYGDNGVGNLLGRKQLRLKGYDYSQAGYYFITACTHNRESLFGQVVGADSISARLEMILNDAGMMVQKIYCNLQNQFENVKLHQYVIMPNHFHGIIQIQNSRADIESAPTSIPTIIQTFKRYTTIEYIHGVKNNIYLQFNNYIWQRGYHEYIIRNEQDMMKIKEYIINNPAKWQQDKYFI
jgi:REP element-mobilizing transposase RayT